MAKKSTQPHPAIDFSEAALDAWHGRLGLLQLFEICNRLSGQGQNPLAAVLYQTWLKRNRTSHDHLVLFNLGVLLFSEGDLVGAGEVYRRALHLDPSFLQPRFNLGLVTSAWGRAMRPLRSGCGSRLTRALSRPSNARYCCWH